MCSVVIIRQIFALEIINFIPKISRSDLFDVYAQNDFHLIVEANNKLVFVSIVPLSICSFKTVSHQTLAQNFVIDM